MPFFLRARSLPLALFLLAGLVPFLDVPEARAASFGVSELHEAIDASDEAQIDELLRGDVAVDQQDGFGRSLLYMAARAGNLALARELLIRGADVRLANLGGMTPLHAAAAHGHADVAELLLVNCAPIDARDRLGRTALHVAAARGHTAVARVLVSSQAEVEARLPSGLTAFGTAISHVQPETTAYLRSQLPEIATEPPADAPEGSAPEVAAGPSERERARERPRGTQGTTLFVQEKLSQLGYAPGPVNGDRSARTLDAVRAFQDAIGVVHPTERGQITRCLLDRLSVATFRSERPSDAFDPR